MSFDWFCIFCTFREYCPEYDRLKKLQVESRAKNKAEQMKKFEGDFKEDSESFGISSQRRVSHHNEILLRNRAVGGESSDEEQELEEDGR